MVARESLHVIMTIAEKGVGITGIDKESEINSKFSLSLSSSPSRAGCVNPKLTVCVNEHSIISCCFRITKTSRTWYHMLQMASLSYVTDNVFCHMLQATWFVIRCK